jgi:hypothetical protein
VRHLSASLSEPFGVLQAALLGVVGLILAFGLSLALSRYEERRTAIVAEANAIGTTYLRAQTLAEPMRNRSLKLLVTYTRSAIGISEYPPGSATETEVTANENRLQRHLWALGARALEDDPMASAPRLYIETLNKMIDAQDTRIAALNNQVPAMVLLLEVVGAALALGLLSAYLALVGRGLVGVLLASMLVALLIFVTSDLDRPTRGPIEIPDTVLTDLYRSMQQPPAAPPPHTRDLETGSGGS